MISRVRSTLRKSLATLCVLLFPLSITYGQDPAGPPLGSPNIQQTAPLLIRVEEKAGHGAGIPLAKRIVEQADQIAFMSKVLDVEGKC